MRASFTPADRSTLTSGRDARTDGTRPLPGNPTRSALQTRNERATPSTKDEGLRQTGSNYRNRALPPSDTGDDAFQDDPHATAFSHPQVHITGRLSVPWTTQPAVLDTGVYPDMAAFPEATYAPLLDVSEALDRPAMRVVHTSSGPLRTAGAEPVDSATSSRDGAVLISKLNDLNPELLEHLERHGSDALQAFRAQSHAAMQNVAALVADYINSKYEGQQVRSIDAVIVCHLACSLQLEHGRVDVEAFEALALRYVAPAHARDMTPD